ncbi:MAG: protein kinase domain-containing protein [Blastocatellia bacterium]
MTSEQLDQLSGLYHAALELEPHQRHAFLRERCRDDQNLLHEVEQLLEANENVGSFLAKPVQAVDEPTQLTSQKKESDQKKESEMIGRRFRQYRILSRIGAGGMGEVYLAKDETLGRKVALKLLPVTFGDDPDRLHRFVREAKAASATAHPNIVTIHEIGEDGGIHFIAEEFVEGQTLRGVIKQGAVSLFDALDITHQTANALAAAHSAGVVHRDIKPENIMLRPDGFVKVLDFGLATVAPITEGVFPDSQSPTIPAETVPGTIMGTVTYMSPEQTRGQKADARSDLWSLGVVLFELLSGEPPFQGESIPDVFVAILDRQPPYLADTRPEVEAIALKLLAKKREQRYQSAKELATELKALKRRLEFEADSGSQPLTTTGGSGSIPERNSSGENQSLGTETQIFLIQRGDQSGQFPGQFQSSPHPIPPAPRAGRYRMAVFGLLAGLTIALAITAYWLTLGAKATNSIAVMPLVNEGKNPDLDYLAEGLTEELINNLSQLPKLKVMSRGSVFRYKGQEIDPGIIGDKLDIQSVLIGRLSQHGADFSINLELIDTSDSHLIWGHQYSVKQADLLTMHVTIASEVSRQLKLQLSQTDQNRVAKRHTNNPEAYQLYLKGQFFWNKSTEESYYESIKRYEEAIKIDPTFALAYAGLAYCYITLSSNYMPASEAIPKAKFYAAQALKLDEELAEAHYAIAVLSRAYDWNWAKAEQEINRTLELNPNHSGIYVVRSHLMKTLGRMNESIADTKKALELDPQSLFVNTNVAWAYYFARQPDLAIEQCQETLKMDPNYSFALQILGSAYELKGKPDQAITTFQKAVKLDPSNLVALAYLGHAFARAGKKTEALKTLDELKQISATKHVRPHTVAEIYAALGNHDEAVTWLEKAFEEKSSFLTLIKAEPKFDPLRSEPKFQDLMRRIGLP